MQYISCNICGSGKHTEVYADKKVRYVMCNVCTLVYLNPRPSAKEYRAFYDKEYQVERHAVAEYTEALERLKRKDSYGTKKKIYIPDFKERIKDKPRVLEIGAGWGTLLKALVDEYGVRAVGVEISELAARVGREHYGLDMRHQTFDEFIASGRNDELFDCILMVHVFEHFLDPAGELQKAATLLKKDGYLYFALPSITIIPEPLDRYFHFEHTYYFSPNTLNLLLEKLGFKLLSLTTRTDEMVVFAARKAHTDPALDTSGFPVQYSRERVLRAIKRQDTKYRILRALKRSARALLPEKAFYRLKGPAIRVLKKLKIISV